MWQNKKYIEQANKIGSKVFIKQQETSVFRLQELLQAQQTVTGTHPTCTKWEIHTQTHVWYMNMWLPTYKQSKEKSVYII